MNDLIRPSLYGAYHEICPLSEAVLQRPKYHVDVVGPVCESGDFLAKDRSLPEVNPGDMLAVMSAGAYGFVMASNYNSRPRVPEVLIKDGEIHVIKTRETYDDLVKGEMRFQHFLTEEWAYSAPSAKESACLQVH